jgi:hypothetical protein
VEVHFLEAAHRVATKEALKKTCELEKHWADCKVIKKDPHRKKLKPNTTLKEWLDKQKAEGKKINLIDSIGDLYDALEAQEDGQEGPQDPE